MDASKFIGRCPEQVEEFVEEEVRPAIEPYANDLVNGETAEIKV